MDSGMEPTASGTATPLSPALIGSRVVVRYRLVDAPWRTDVLGILSDIEADGTLVVTADRDGRVRRVPAGRVVAAKPVPPRAVRAARSR